MTILLVFALALPWLLIVFGCWLGYQIVRQHGRILLSLERLENGFSGGAAEPAGSASPALNGLPKGSLAPEFELPDLSGVPHRLSEFRERTVLLIFFNPACGFCTGMASELAAFASEHRKGKPLPLVISTGDPEANRHFFQSNSIGCLVFLQKNTEVATEYQAQGTPMGYLVDETGALSSELAMGAEALVTLMNSPTPHTAPESSLGQTSDRATRGNKPLNKSRLNRSGLRAGAVAPDFRLPSLDGRDVALEDSGASDYCLSSPTPVVAHASCSHRTWNVCIVSAAT